MKKSRASTTADPDGLMALMRAIAARNERVIYMWLAATPRLVHDALAIGATRASAAGSFLTEIEHYVYAGDTALHVAAAAYDLALVRDLIARGADVGARNRRGAEPLHYAVDGGPTLRTWDPRAQADVVAHLVAEGANPNAIDKSGVAPIHRAARSRTTGAVRALLDAGADPRLKNKSGSTPMDLAATTTGRGGSGTPAAKREAENIVQLLEAALRPGAARAR